VLAKLTQKYAPAAAVGVALGVGSGVGERFAGPPSAGEYDAGPARRRRRGLSGRDIEGAQRVARVVQAFGYKPKIKRTKRRR